MANQDKRQYPPIPPGNYGDYATAIDAPDDRFVLNLRDGQTVTISPTRAVEPAKYLRLGVRLNINGGSSTPGNMTAVQRSMFIKDGNVKDINPGKPLTQYTESECRQVARFLYNNKGGFGVLTGEAGESSTDWRLMYTYAPQQMKWIAQGIQDLKQERPEIITGPPNYAGVTVAARNRTNYNDLLTGVSSPANARALMSAIEWDFIHYFGGGFNLIGEIPLLNAYLTQNDPAEMFYQTLIRMELIRIGNQGIFADEYEMFLFNWVRCASGLDPFTERFEMDYKNGLRAHTADFNIQSPSLQLHQSAMALDHGKHLVSWENNILFGTDTNVIAAPYDTARYSLEGSTAGRTFVERYKSVPWQSGQLYPYPNIPYGHEDLTIQGAKMATNGRDYVNARIKPIRWRKAGTGAWMAIDNTFLPKTVFDGLPHVTGATLNGKNRLVMYDPLGTLASSGSSTDIEVEWPSGIKTYECWVGVRNEFFD